MISVCIPIHNYYAYPLARRIANQMRGLDQEVEIVCIDDHSSAFYENQNRGLAEISTYVRLAENIGRARIRNLFLKYAKGDYLLFLNDDSVVPDAFLKDYIRHLPKNPEVIVGGRTYDSSSNDRSHRLNYLYGTKVESRSAEERKRTPYRSFMANNFLIRRDILAKYPFNTRISKNGHEDLMFGYVLEQNKVPVLHINNSVIKGNVGENVEFLHKSVEAVENLTEIYDMMWEDQRFCRSVKLISTYERIRRMGLVKLIYGFYKMAKSPMESHFVRGTAITLSQFNFYKLGIFIKKMQYDTEES